MPEAKIVSADGTQLAARCSGSGSPLVLVHGAMANLDAFALVEGPLAQRHTVWVYSRRGRGGSGDGPDYGLEREIEDVLAVLEAAARAAGEDAHLLGHSSGGFYSLLAAPRARSLRSLMLYEPPLHVDRVDPALVARMRSALEEGDPDRALETFFPVADIVEAEAAAIRHGPLWEALRHGVTRFPREHLALEDEGRKLLSETRLPDVPILYLYGELTGAPVFPTLDEVSQRFPTARLHGLPGQRHMAPAFDPAAFAKAVLAFTTALGPSRGSG